MFKPPPIEQAATFRAAATACTVVGSRFARFDLPHHLSQFRADRPTLLFGNHRSLFDLVACLATFDQVKLSGHILIQARYFRSKVGGPALRGIGAIPLDRHNHREAEQSAVDRLGENKIVAIMPEGRLVRPDEWVDGVGPGRPGGARIALAAGAQLVAIGFAGTEKVWPPRQRPRVPVGRRPTVVLRASDPFLPDGDDPIAITDQMMNVLRQTVAEAAAVEVAG